MTTEQETDQPDVAPRWHTVALILLIVGVAVVGTVWMSDANPPTRTQPTARWPLYASMLVVPCMLTFYVARLGRTRGALGSLVGRRPRALDVAIAGACALVVRLAEALFSRPDPTRTAALAEVLPRTTAERIAWLVVATVVGFGEEVVYRGYLRQQLFAFSRSRALAIVGQAVLFGIAHLNQGPASACRVAMYGALFGVVVTWRGSLWPALLAHVAIDAMPAFTA